MIDQYRRVRNENFLSGTGTGTSTGTGSRKTATKQEVCISALKQW